MGEVSLGQYALAPLLTVILALIYKFVPVEFPDRFKALIAIGFAIGLSIAAAFYKGLDITFIVVVDYALHGLMLGASAVGIYELQRTVTKPRG